jgi:hypothetical protein
VARPAAVRLGLDLEPVGSRAERDAEEAQESFLPEQVERERPRLAKRDGRLVTDSRNAERGARVPGPCPDPANHHLVLVCIREVDPGRLGEPGTEAIRGRTRVDEAALRRILEVFDLHEQRRARKLRPHTWELDEIEPHDGAMPPASQS